MAITFEKMKGNLKDPLAYYYVYDEAYSMDLDTGKLVKPIMTLNNISGKWELHINHSNTDYQTVLALGKADDWSFEKLKPYLIDFVEAYLKLMWTPNLEF